MGFWIFMFVMDLLIPFAMIGFGALFTKKAPKNINLVFGYQSGMSMKNRDTWEFAHKFCGRIWYVCGLGLLAVAVIAMLFVIGKDIDLVGKVGGIVCAVELVPLVGSIVSTEIALRKNFDKFGNRRCPL